MAEPGFELDLVDNALDYIIEAASLAQRKDVRELKYAVLHLAAGLELIMKARLRVEHWSLLFANVNEASKDGLDSGDFKSVDFEGCCTRLDKVCGVKLDKKDKDRLAALRKLRNRLQHFDVSINEASANAELAFGISFVVRFVEKQLPGEMENYKDQLEELHQGMARFKEYVAERMKAIGNELKTLDEVFDCPLCGQPAVLVDGGNTECKFCGAKPTPMSLAEHIGGPIDWCPECYDETCVQKDDGVWVCTSCGQCGQYSHCLKCGRLYSGEKGTCNDCYHAAVDSAD